MLVEDDFEDLELTAPVAALRAAGAEVILVGPAPAAYRGKRGASVTAELPAVRARMSAFDGLLIPGGYAPDRMRLRHPMVDLAREAMAAGKVVGGIGHAAQLLISANALRGRTLTCWPWCAGDV